MSSALILYLILYLMGVAVGAPASTSPETPKLNSEIEVTTGESPTDSSTSTIGPTSGLSEFEKECEMAWQKFLVDFDVHYKNDSDLEKRRYVFCGNWRTIRDHNILYDMGFVSFRESIDQFSDLSLEERLQKKGSSFKPEITKESSKKKRDDCQDAWEKFLIDFRSQHRDSYEAEKRRDVFCGNWRASLEQNVQYDKTTDRALENQPSPAPEISKEEPRTSMSKIDHDDITCQAAWKNFMIDFKRKYEDDNETKQRRNIFCDNWNSIQKHNVQYDLGKFSFKKGINQWSDLTVEEWKNKQRPEFNPEFSKLENTTNISKDIKDSNTCQAAWNKFLIDFGAKYQDDKETEKRRNIFCDNWNSIQKHNAQYDLGTTSFKKGINQWSDLTVEEWKNQQQPEFNPEFSKLENTTNISKDIKDSNTCQAAWNKFLIDFGAKYQDDKETEKRRNIFCDNWNSIQKHNAQYDLGTTSFKKGINQWSDLTVEEWKNKQQPNLSPEFSIEETTTEMRKEKK